MSRFRRIVLAVAAAVTSALAAGPSATAAVAGTPTVGISVKVGTIGYPAQLSDAASSVNPMDDNPLVLTNQGGYLEEF